MAIARFKEMINASIEETWMNDCGAYDFEAIKLFVSSTRTRKEVMAEAQAAAGAMRD